MEIRSRNISLKEKLQQRFDEKKKLGFKPTFGCMNRWAPLWYVLIIFGVAYWGIFDALPSIYRNSNPLLLQINTYFSCLMFAEVMVNWICIHIVDSSYRPNIHGTKLTDSSNDMGVETVDMGYSPTENGNQPRNNYTMYVATYVSNKEGTVHRDAYPYWSWVPCLMCQRLRPPRCHHCTICGICVLKRDHHCYFSRACIGVNNQRHFMVFLFWAFMGSMYSTLHMLPYFYYDVFPSMGYVDIIPPVAMIRVVFGYQNLVIAVLMTLAWGLVSFTVLSGNHFFDSFNLIVQNRTSFEKNLDIKLTDNRVLSEKLRAVFGNYWFLNFIIPMHLYFKPMEDAVLWPSIKI